MKLRKLLMCILAAAAASGMLSTHTYAAEMTDEATAITTEVKEDAQATEESDKDLQKEDISYQSDTAEDKKEALSDGTEKIEAVEEAVKELVSEDKVENAFRSLEEDKDNKKISVKKASTEKTKAAKEYSDADVRLLAALISCEAGSEPYAGKLAVGIVVLNRKKSNAFPNSVKGVIYDKYQFGPARNGTLSKTLNRYDNGKFNSVNDKACIKAAKQALSGVKKVTYKGKTINMSNFLYFSGRVSGAKLRIANHQFK